MSSPQVVSQTTIKAYVIDVHARGGLVNLERHSYSRKGRKLISPFILPSLIVWLRRNDARHAKLCMLLEGTLKQIKRQVLEVFFGIRPYLNSDLSPDILLTCSFPWIDDNALIFCTKFTPYLLPKLTSLFSRLLHPLFRRPPNGLILLQPWPRPFRIVYIP